MKNIKDLKDVELLEEYEHAVTYRHYDYGVSIPNYALDDLREEMINRIGKAYHPLNDPD